MLEGYSHKPKLDMRRVCEETDAVKEEVENRKGDLRAADVGVIVRHYITLHYMSFIKTILLRELKLCFF